MTACQSSPYPSIEDLLVEASAFPSDWHSDPDGPGPDPSGPGGGIRSLERTTLSFESATAGAYETIKRFRDSEKADDEYLIQEKILFTDTDIRGPYLPPDQVHLEGLVADRYRVACWKPEYTQVMGCSYLAQYGPYLVDFSFSWDTDTLSPVELEKVMQAIDEKFVDFAE
jgi:hypothetical protein